VAATTLQYETNNVPFRKEVRWDEEPDQGATSPSGVTLPIIDSKIEASAFL
jgi:hypothetical protein